MTKYTVVTTFNEKGYNHYGQRMIETFVATWPQEIELWVYSEACEVITHAPNVRVFNQEQQVPALQAFKTKWRDVPKANGDVMDDPIRSKRKDAGKGFKWDAIRFSHKVYSIFHAAKHTDADWLLWMDADMVCHSPVEMSFIDRMCPPEKDLCFLGRAGKYSECGLYAVNLKSKGGIKFLKRFQKYYDNAEEGIFTLAEWHDSYVFDAVRRLAKQTELDWSAGLIRGEGHPLINSEWGSYLDHLKGKRKDYGRSLKRDLKSNRNEAYWQQIQV